MEVEVQHPALPATLQGWGNGLVVGRASPRARSRKIKTTTRLPCDGKIKFFPIVCERAGKIEKNHISASAPPPDLLKTGRSSLFID